MYTSDKQAPSPRAVAAVRLTEGAISLSVTALITFIKELPERGSFFLVSPERGAEGTHKTCLP